MKFSQQSLKRANMEEVIQPEPVPEARPIDRCDLFIGKIPVETIVKLLQTMSLLNKEDVSWWDSNVDTRMTEFEEWIGDPMSPSKVIVRKYVAENKYKSILDCGCGLCSEYYGYKNDGVDIQYIGLDSCAKLVSRAESKGIGIVKGSIESIPIPDNAVEVAYARHVLEHIFGYESALSEMIRVATKEVIVTFFIHPHDCIPAASNLFKFDVVEEIWHNQYQKALIEIFIGRNLKVESFSWNMLPELNESVLHILLKQPQEDEPEVPAEAV